MVYFIVQLTSQYNFRLIMLTKHPNMIKNNFKIVNVHHSSHEFFSILMTLLYLSGSNHQLLIEVKDEHLLWIMWEHYIDHSSSVPKYLSPNSPMPGITRNSSFKPVSISEVTILILGKCLQTTCTP